jgi:hypothetical protein
MPIPCSTAGGYSERFFPVPIPTSSTRPRSPRRTSRRNDRSITFSGNCVRGSYRRGKRSELFTACVLFDGGVPAATPVLCSLLCRWP